MDAFKAIFTAPRWRGVYHTACFPIPSSGAFSGGGVSIHKVLGGISSTTRFRSISLLRSGVRSLVKSVSGSSMFHIGASAHG